MGFLCFFLCTDRSAWITLQTKFKFFQVLPLFTSNSRADYPTLCPGSNFVSAGFHSNLPHCEQNIIRRSLGTFRPLRQIRKIVTLTHCLGLVLKCRGHTFNWSSCSILYQTVFEI